MHISTKSISICRIFLIKRLVAWYFERKIGQNSKKLGIMKEQKQKIIEQVKDKETYKVALELLNRFGDKTNGFKAQGTVSRIIQITTHVFIHNSLLQLYCPLQIPLIHPDRKCS